MSLPSILFVNVLFVYAVCTDKAQFTFARFDADFIIKSYLNPTVHSDYGIHVLSRESEIFSVKASVACIQIECTGRKKKNCFCHFLIFLLGQLRQEEIVSMGSTTNSVFFHSLSNYYIYYNLLMQTLK